jgi:8-oxo-(d)GTP phosphatase
VSLVRAGGGVVTRTGAAGDEVVLVHRPSYDDWSFPKGKLEDDEDERRCALREVEEEASLRCELVRDLGAIAYRDGQGRPKVVRYWHMRAPDGAEARARHEIDEARWVPLAEAEPMLTYVHDRTLLRRLAGEAPDTAPVAVFVVRHVKAGLRGQEQGPDELRGISRTGRKQAVKLAAVLAAQGVRTLVSSPSLRCIQTLDPLAEHLGVDITLASELSEGSDPAGALAWVAFAAAEGPAVLCTHGDVLQGMIDGLRDEGVPIGGDGMVGFEKGAAWRLEVFDGGVRKMTYVPAPEGPRPSPVSGFAI